MRRGYREITALRRLFPSITSQCHRCLCSHAPGLTNTEVRRKRVSLFEEEKARQFSLIRRTEKIQVDHKGPPEDCTLIMNKGISTPFNCAMHIQELLMDRSALALVNGEAWDMHRPLTEDCELRFMHFKDEDPRIVNNAYWRSCSFMLGHVLETAFKDSVYVELCSFPAPNVRSGSFVYDVDLTLPNWKPTSVDLRILTSLGQKLNGLDLKIERLDIEASLALKMFEDNRFKVQQIPDIAASSRFGNSVTLYKMGDHIDISRGPMIAGTNLCWRFNVTAIHSIENDAYGPLSRVQGCGLPRDLYIYKPKDERLLNKLDGTKVIHYLSYEFLLNRARKLNQPTDYGSHGNSRKLIEDKSEVTLEYPNIVV